MLIYHNHQIFNIIWKYKNTTSVTATAVVLLLIRNSINAEIAEPVCTTTIVGI